MATDGITVVATNRLARRNYDIIDTIECGMVLLGSEVKSLRESKVQLAESYARIRNGEAWLQSLHVAPYSHSTRATGHDPDREKKLLLKRAEIDRIAERLDRERLELVALSLYFKDGRAKVEIGVARGRTKADRREKIAARDADMEARRAMSARRRR